MNTYQFRILDPRRVGASAESAPLANRLYQTWQDVFSKVVEEGGGILDPDDYFRNDFALVIYDGEQILGFSLCTEFDLRLRACADHHYWRALKPETLRFLSKRCINRIMSMEYLTVLPQWRKPADQISWAEVLVGLGLLYQDHFPLDAMIGTPRVDLRMGSTCEGMGGIPIQEPIQKMNYPCAVQLFDRAPVGARRFNSILTHKWAHQLWSQRTDIRTQTEPIKKQTAA